MPSPDRGKRMKAMYAARERTVRDAMDYPPRGARWSPQAKAYKFEWPHQKRKRLAAEAAAQAKRE